MADMHVLKRTGDEYTVVMHFPIPATNNSAAIPWASALVNSGLGGTTILPDGDGTGGTISAAEKTSVLAGTILEHSASYLIESDGQASLKVQGALRTFYAREQATIQAKLQRELKWFGAVESGG
ncbi:MAG: hypothetical protein ACE5HM_04390, partial [Acidiferrobacterales bacterium]